MGKPKGGLIMKLNRVLSAFVLTGLFSMAAMAAQAQTRIMVRFGSPAAGVAVNYTQPAYGNGYTWVSGYYNGVQWIPGQRVYRVDSRYQQRYNDRKIKRNPRIAILPPEAGCSTFRFWLPTGMQFECLSDSINDSAGQKLRKTCPATRCRHNSTRCRVRSLEASGFASSLLHFEGL